MEMQRTPLEDRSIAVEAGTGTVRLDGVPVELSRRERACVAALASHDGPAPPGQLATQLYPDCPRGAAANAVKVYVYRLRRRIAIDFIVFRHGGYALGPSVAVDLRSAMAALAALRRGQRPVDPGTRDTLLDIGQRLRSDGSALDEEEATHRPIASRLKRLGRDLAMGLARAAIEHADPHEATRIAQELTYEDPCDEEAWELLIRIHLRMGERGAASSAYRYYETFLAQELDAIPSPYIRQLFNDAHRIAAL